MFSLKYRYCTNNGKSDSTLALVFAIDENDRDPTKTQHIVTHTRDDIRYLLVLLLEHRLEIYVQLDQVLGKPADENPDVCRNFD
jgi:hypothetical protein